MKINQIIINELSESAQPGVATTAAQTPQAQAAAQAIQKGLAVLQQQLPNFDASFNTTDAIQEIMPDGTVVMDSNLQPSALQNVRKILALGGGANFKVTMSTQTIPSATGQQVALQAKPGVAEGDRPFRGVDGARYRDNDEQHDLDPTDWYIVKDGEMFLASIYPNDVQQAIAQGFSRTEAEAEAEAEAKLRDNSQGVAEGSLEEIDRRGFLKGIGAATVAGAAGTAGYMNRGMATWDKKDDREVYDLIHLYIVSKELTKPGAQDIPKLPQQGDQPRKLGYYSKVPTQDEAQQVHNQVKILIQDFVNNNPKIKEEINRIFRDTPDGRFLLGSSNGISTYWDKNKIISNFNIWYKKQTTKPKAEFESVNQGVAEAGNANSGRRGPDYQDNSPVVPGRVEHLPQGLRHHADASRYGGTEPDDKDDRLLGPQQRHRLHRAVTPDDLDEQEKIAGRHDPDDFDNMVGRLKQLAGAGPLKTVWDPAKRVYKNVPHAVQPAQQPKKAPQ